MSVFTTIWNLLKKNPSTDGNDTFNIQTMLNDNWDKLDAALGMKGINAAVRAATVGNIGFSGLQTIDGVTLAVGDRVLVKNQITGSNNGIYLVAAEDWTRTSDADTSAKLSAGLFVHVLEGSTNAGTGWLMTTSGTITLGTTALTFAQKTGPGAATDAVIGTRIIDDTVTASAGADTPTRLWSKLANLIKAITGKANWYTPPATTIEALNSGKLNASAYTAADVLAKIKTVDGSGSGLDAETVGGYHASQSATGNTVVARDANGAVSGYTLVSTAGNGQKPLYITSSTLVDNLNTDMVDGKHASDFLLQPTGIPGNADLNDYKTPGMFYCSSNASASSLSNSPTGNAFSLLVERHAGFKQTLTEYPNGSSARTWTRNYYQAWGSWFKVWDERSDGSGSEMDADMVDGFHLDQDVRTTASPSFKRLTVAGTVGNTFIDSGGNQIAMTRPGANYLCATSEGGYFNFVVNGIGGNDANASFQLQADGNARFNGALTMPANWNDAAPEGQKYALHLNNSNIIGANAIAFNDPSDASVEGLMWPKTGINAPSDNPSDYNTLRVDGSGAGWIGSEKITTARASVSEVNVSVANSEVVVAFVNSADAGNYDVRTYLRVTAATTLTVKVTYTDASGAQTINISSSESFAAGSYSLLPVFLNAVSGHSVNVVVRTSVANAIKVSASIVGV